MWEGIKYFFKNLIKLICLFVTILLLFSLDKEDITGEPMVGIFFIFLLFINVVTVYDFGEFLVLVSETGASLFLAFVLYFAVNALLVAMVENANVVSGIILILLAINRGIEVKKYDCLPMFFIVTGIIFAVLALVNGIIFFIRGPQGVPVAIYLLDFLFIALELVNIIARATQADGVED